MIGLEMIKETLFREKLCLHQGQTTTLHDF